MGKISAWAFRNRQRKLRTESWKQLQRYLYETAKKLQENPPQSEVWFRARWRELGMNDEMDRFNYPYEFYIPDVRNAFYRYIIEVDGDVHEEPKVKRHDKKKDLFYAAKGYTVIRVKAYDEASLIHCMERVERIKRSKSCRK